MSKKYAELPVVIQSRLGAIDRVGGDLILHEAKAYSGDYGIYLKADIEALLAYVDARQAFEQVGTHDEHMAKVHRLSATSEAITPDLLKRVKS